MKVNKFFMIAFLITIAIFASISGCKYNVAEPLWEQSYTPPGSPTVTGIIPVGEAKGGVNYITITGQNFADSGNIVYFNRLVAEIVSNSSSQIVVRRPNLVSDSCVATVVTPGAYLSAKSQPYKIDQVTQHYGNFLAPTIKVNTVTVDSAGNLYATIGNLTNDIYKITPGGVKTKIGKVGVNTPTEARISPDGKRLVFFYGFTKMLSIDLNGADTAATQWYKSSTKVLKYADFDEHGIMYGGGRASGLVTMKTSDSSYTVNSTYGSDVITGIRVCNDYVYVIDTNAASKKIYRHQIMDSNGTLGSQELVLDWMTTKFSNRLITGITFSADGSYMYIATAADDPLLILTMATGNLDILYKGILAGYINSITSSPGNFLYLSTGNSALSNYPYTAYQVDVGTPGAPNY